MITTVIMGVYGIYTIAIVLIIALLLILNRFLYYKDGEAQETYDAILNVEELERHAVEIARNHVVDKKTKVRYSLESRMNKNFKFITGVYKSLNDYINDAKRVTPAAEWLLDNFYIIEEQVKEIRLNLSKKYYSQLPTLKTGSLKGYPRAYAIALELVSHTDGRFDDKVLINFIMSYQAQSLLSSGELWAIPLMVRMALIEHIRFVCDMITQSQQQWHKAEKLADILLSHKDKPEELLHLAKEYMRHMESITPSYSEHLLNRLKKQGLEIAPIIRYIDERLSEQHTTGEDITQLEHNEQAARQVSMGNSITSLRNISSLDWTEIFESLSKVENILRQDPDNTYSLMDFSSRDYYRHEVEKLSKKYRVSEIQVARKAIECAAGAGRHVGYYILGKNKNELKERLGYSPRKSTSTIFVFIGSIVLLTLLIVFPFLYYGAANGVQNAFLLFLIGLALLIPASDIAVNIVNRIATHIYSPAFLPKLELKEGIPAEARTIVVIPTLLTNDKRVAKLLEQLEEYYLANKEKNLYFALLGDFKDCDEARLPADEEITKTAIRIVGELNKRYGKGHDVFFYLHRKRTFNEVQKKWMGWERKRGALVEFNELLRGSKKTGISITAGNLAELKNIRYVLTIDADTKLPMDIAKKLIGTIFHPINRAVVDEKRGKVTEGYGLLQPRINVDIISANASPFSRIFAGQGGIDIYTNAISDVYQDLFGEGIYTGKGIYELDVFEQVLANAIPDNTVLSHDLIEGSYVRTGLVTDIELIDGYPARYNAHSMRLHRWVRGDWQLIGWLSAKVRDRQGKVRRNPLNTLSKWKILDNLRRSLIAPASTLLFFLALTILPGNKLIWFLFTLSAILFPYILSLIDILVNKINNQFIEKSCCPIGEKLKITCWQGFLTLAFLPYQAYLMLNAILKTLGRVYITKKNMLEWVTAADMEQGLKNDQGSFWKRMWQCPVLGVIAFALALVYGINIWFLALLLSIAWIMAPSAAYSVSRVEDKKKKQLSVEEMSELRKLSRKTWGFFEEFVTAMENYLPPDNYQESPPNGIAHRTSPTNIGLLLISTIAARDFGYISTADMLERINKTMSTIEKMAKWKGHLYNWYDTITLEVLRPQYVSTVDSGNFVAYLMTLRQGLLEYQSRPLVDRSLLLGIRDTIALVNEEQTQDAIPAQLTEELLAKSEIKLADWKALLDKINELNDHKKPRWGYKLSKMAVNLKKELQELLPWVELLASMPEELEELRLEGLDGMNMREYLQKEAGENKSLSACAYAYRKLLLELNAIDMTDKEERQASWVKRLKSELEAACGNIEAHLGLSRNLIERTNIIIDETEFIPLYDHKRKLFSIGYNKDDEQLTRSYYDLLASEARQASFIAIARGEIKKEHWFMLDRTLTSVDGRKGLVSWTGTMFEYIMPLLIMKNYDNTILDETYKFVVRCQREYGKKRRVPWGVSESGYYAFDFRLNYQYKAFGVPTLGLKRGLINDTVIAPYATMLALPIEPAEAMKNLLILKKEGLEGPYGYYEAIDYTPERLSKNRKNSVVKSFMAHHQGMGFIAMNNFVNDDIMQARFHSDAIVKAAELLLQEKIPSKIIFAKDYKEKIEPFKEVEKEEIEFVTVLGMNTKSLPEAHLLSNGNYSVMVTDNGSGYSRHNGIAVTRWREDALENKSGTFFYVQDVDTNKVWSTAASPNFVEADKYKIIFSQDKAVFLRTDSCIDTQTEIIVSPEDDVELRRITLTNHSQQTRVLEITSYLEAVLTHQSSDVAHPAFSNLFIKTEYVSKYNSLMAVRRPREQHKAPVWAVHTLSVEAEVLGGIQYETDRAKFIGRNRELSNPSAMEPNSPLSNTVGPVIDPIMSLRARIRIQSGQTVRLCYVTGIAGTHEGAVSLMEKYHESSAIDRGFELAWTRSQVELRYLNLEKEEIELYRHMLSQILYLTPARRRLESIIARNTKGQPGLWAYGISGDLPIILVTVSKRDEVELVNELLKAHEYWRIKGLMVDLVIINNDESSYTQPLYNLLQDIVSISHARDIREKTGGVFIKSGNLMNEEDRVLLTTAARLVLDGSKGSLSVQVRLRDIDDKFVCRQWKEKKKNWELPDMKQPELLYYNGYGGFTPDGREYVIKLADGMTTPLPWINVISNRKFGFQISESGGGYTWSENSRENKLTQWANDPIQDTPSEILYVRDEDTGELWTITPQPIREREDYIIRHGFGYSVFEHISHGIVQQQLEYVPIEDSIKLIVTKLKNSSKKARVLTLTYYIKPVLGVNEQQTAQFISTEMDKNGTLLIKNTYNTDYLGRIAFLDATSKEKSYTGDRREFIGRKGSLSYPEAMKKEKLSDSAGIGFDPCACLQVRIELKPNEEKRIGFMLGQGSDIGEVRRLSAKYRNMVEADKAFNEVTAYWQSRLSTIRVRTPDTSMDTILNGWILYQTIVCRMWARSAFYQSGGAYGFRDQLQDAMSIVYIMPEATRRQILFHAAHQFVEGDVQHWWHPGVDKGIRTKFSDDLLWLPYVTADYIKVTEDWSILDEEICYLEDELLKDNEDEKYGIPRLSNYKSSVYEHCIRAIEHSLKFGQHGIPLMGSGDWNDGMSTVGNKGKGESVWMGWFLYSILMSFAPICQSRNDLNRAERYVNISKEIVKALEENAWDGNWYRRAYFDNGIPLGSAENTECKIDSLAQSWAIISGAGRPDRTREAIEAVEHYLIRKDDGLILLLTPPFDEGDLEPGYIKGYLPGVRENGGQYTHAAVWVVLAFAKMGYGDKAWELYNLLNPINHAATAMEAARYKVEPYVMAADVYAVQPHIGRGGWTWYTGASGWMYRVGIQHILGLNKEGDKLIMNPCIPKGWGEYTIEYKYKNTSYEILVKNPSKVSRGVKSIQENGQSIEDNIIHLRDDEKLHKVEVVMG